MRFDVETLGGRLKDQCPNIVFIFLHGSARDGNLRSGGDIDLALFVRGKPGWDLYGQVEEIAETVVPGVKIDIGILNEAEPIYRFEALKGRLLFCRDMESYMDFFSLVCREYESQIADYERQKKYRMVG
ncbi:MAG: nucleotidyltransferase domain-containing protein [Phycisphaerae bacterium]